MKKGKDCREEGIAWIIRELWKMGEHIFDLYLPTFLDQRGVVIQMELLNSRVDHKDYMCDRSSWGVELCKRLGSPNFKLLFDIYHMQID